MARPFNVHGVLNISYQINSLNASANSTRVLQQEFLLAISTELNCVVHSYMRARVTFTIL